MRYAAPLLAWTMLATPVSYLNGQTTGAPTSSSEYVAMGSSFAAGPGIGVPDPDGPERCRRSTENYAHLLAKKRGLLLKDATCSGATTQSILVGSPGLPPQLDALGPQTKLVTVTIGGNDVGFMASLSAWSREHSATAGAPPVPPPARPGELVPGAPPPATGTGSFSQLDLDLHTMVRRFIGVRQTR